MQTVYVSASELAEYIYCQCCWVDRMEGLREQTLAMQKGIEEHDHIQGEYFRSRMLRRIAIFLVVISLTVLLIFLFFNVGLRVRLW